MELVYAINEEEMYRVGSLNVESDTPFVLSLDEKLSDLTDFLRLYKKPTESSCSPYRKMQRTLFLNNRETIGSIPEERRREFLERQIRDIRSVLEDTNGSDYITYYVRAKKFLRDLNKPIVSHQKITSLVNKIDHDHVKSRVRDFGSSKKKTTYSMSGTVTGRLVVTNGPNILTLPAETRSCLTSKYNKGKILQIDLISAEPYMALLYTGQEPPTDIYQHVSEVILENKVSRDQAKIVTLSALYGQSSKNLSKALPTGISAREVIEKTKRYFKVDEMKRSLEYDLKSRNFRNVLGRPIDLDFERRDLLVSYFLQSSVAECSIISFDNFVKGTSLNVCPYYVIHDALIFDADEEAAKYLLERKVVEMKASNWLFKAKVTQVSDI